MVLRLPLKARLNPRLLGLLASLVVIIAVSFAIRWRQSESTIDAVQWVAHTQEVRASVFELAASLNAMEAAALEANVQSLSAFASERYRDARARYLPIVERLRELTRDNPDQQERVGMLRARIEGRVALFDELLAKPVKDVDGIPGNELVAAINRFPIDDVAGALIAEEQQLVDSRQATADRRMRVGIWVSVGVTLLQILLLGGLIWTSDGQLKQRVAAEGETERAVQRAQLIVETVREPIALVGSDLGLLHTNQAFADFYGLERPLQAKWLGDVPAWADTVLHQRLRDVSITRRELWDYELQQASANGVVRNVVVNARPMLLPGNAGSVALVTVSDITARKRSEEQVLELNRQLEGKIAQVTEVNRELEAFSYSVSHDLRAPLRHIAGFAEKLRTHIGAAADDKTEHYCNVIADSARRMSSLIEDLLSYSRLGRHAMRLQPVDMQSMVEELRSTLMSSVEERSITWRIAPLPVAVADSSMIRLAWQNLLENAIKYSAGREQALIEVGFNDDGDERVFWIRDNGAGFDMKYVDKLFGVFQRLHKASAFAGTGIGLASVRRIVARHGGRTWAEGVVDDGATFHFSLPRHDITT